MSVINCYLRLTQVKSSSQLVSYIVYRCWLLILRCVCCVCVCLLNTFCWDFIGGLQTYIDHAIIAFTRRHPTRETWALQGKSAIDWLHPPISNHALETPDVFGSRPAHVHCFLSPKESFEHFSVFLFVSPHVSMISGND